MVILEKPYVSDGLLEYLRGTGIPVLKNQFSEQLKPKGKNLNWVSEFDFIGRYHQSKKIYTTSEYALDWVTSVLNDDDLNRQVGLLKDKFAFREACSDLYPDFTFHKLSYAELFTFDISYLQLPLILKTSNVLFNANEYIILDETDWENTLTDIMNRYEVWEEALHDTILWSNTFILESYIEGKKFIVDLYFRDTEPVIINIFEQSFSPSKSENNKRYITNKEIFDNYLTLFTEYTSHLNQTLGLDNIPVHIELRVNEGKIFPIKISPLRFTRMCLNEISYYITGEHPLHYFFADTSPDYSTIWKGKENKTYCFSIIEKSEFTDRELLDMSSIVTPKSDILEIRTVDNPELDIYAFIFSRTIYSPML